MLLAILIFCLLLVKTTNKFIADKIVLELSKEETSISVVPFPAFTVCPEVFHENYLPNFEKEFNVPSDDKYWRFSLDLDFIIFYVTAEHF